MNLEVIHDDGRNKEETKFMVHVPTPLIGRGYEQRLVDVYNARGNVMG